MSLKVLLDGLAEETKEGGRGSGDKETVLSPKPREKGPRRKGDKNDSD